MTFREQKETHNTIISNMLTQGKISEQSIVIQTRELRVKYNKRFNWLLQEHRLCSGSLWLKVGNKYGERTLELFPFQ